MTKKYQNIGQNINALYTALFLFLFKALGKKHIASNLSLHPYSASIV